MLRQVAGDGNNIRLNFLNSFGEDRHQRRVYRVEMKIRKVNQRSHTEFGTKTRSDEGSVR